MPKVSKIKLFLKTNYGEDYEIHYNAKDKPRFSIKGLPEDFTNVTEAYTYGYDTEEQLCGFIRTAVQKYKELKKSQRKVIVYKAMASAELKMNKESEGRYIGTLPGVSQKFDSCPFGVETATFGISFWVMMEVDHLNKKKYHHINEDGSLRHETQIGSKSQIMDWTQEREDFFNNIYQSMRDVVLKMSNFIDKDPESVALFIESKHKLLG